MLTADTTFSLSERSAPPAHRGERAFRIALVVAFLCHAALFIEMARSVPRTIGAEDGRPDAISVEIISAADLKSRETVALPPPGGAPPGRAQPQPPQPEPQPPQPEPPVEAQPQPEAKPPPTAEAKPEEVKPAPQEEKSVDIPDLLKELPDLATIEQPDIATEAAKPAEPKSEPKAEPKPEPTRPTERQKQAEPQAKSKPAPQARLDLSPPGSSDASEAAGPGRSAAATRPPGITRSGENDDFGRAVVRALRGTMPPPDGALGQVTIRLLLTENGDLAQANVIKGSGRAALDQSVVFAARQTYFPLPPYRSTVADRTFFIRYVYR